MRDCTNPDCMNTDPHTPGRDCIGACPLCETPAGEAPPPYCSAAHPLAPEHVTGPPHSRGPYSPREAGIYGRGFVDGQKRLAENALPQAEQDERARDVLRLVAEREKAVPPGACGPWKREWRWRHPDPHPYESGVGPWCYSSETAASDHRRPPYSYLESRWVSAPVKEAGDDEALKRDPAYGLADPIPRKRSQCTCNISAEAMSMASTPYHYDGCPMDSERDEEAGDE